MKLSTKILIAILALIVCGAFVIPVVMFEYKPVSTDDRLKDVTISKSDSTVEITLQPFEEFQVYCNGPYYSIDDNDSLTIELVEDKSLKTPVMQISKNWRPYIKIEQDSVTYEMSFVLPNDSIREINVDPGARTILTVNVPAGMLKKCNPSSINSVLRGFTQPITTTQGEVTFIP
jgi:hypothetical protein